MRKVGANCDKMANTDAFLACT